MQTPAAALLLVLTTLTGLCAAADYPERAQRTQSAGNHTWYIDPDQGNDGNPGTSPSTAWKSMSPANRLIMSRGDTLVIQPGEHAASLALMGEGSRQAPVTIRFMPGRHVFKHGALVTGKPQISNTNDAPNEAKAMAIRLVEAKNVRLEGKPGATDILLEGKAIFVCMEHAENVSLNGLGFDYVHPTMGEFLVTEVEGNTMKATIPDGTLYTVKDGSLTWRGPGWEFRMGGYSKVCWEPPLTTPSTCTAPTCALWTSRHPIKSPSGSCTPRPSVLTPSRWGTGLTTFPARRWFLTPPIPFPATKSSMRRK